MNGLGPGYDDNEPSFQTTFHHDGALLQNHKEIMHADSRSTRNKKNRIRTKHTHFGSSIAHHTLSRHLFHPFFHNLASPFIQHTRHRTKIPFLGHEPTQPTHLDHVPPSLTTVISAHTLRSQSIIIIIHGSQEEEHRDHPPSSDLSQPACRACIEVALWLVLRSRRLHLAPGLALQLVPTIPLRLGGSSVPRLRLVCRDHFIYAWWSRWRSIAR